MSMVDGEPGLFHHRPASSGPAGAVNGVIEVMCRVARSFRNFEDSAYALRWPAVGTAHCRNYLPRFIREGPVRGKSRSQYSLGTGLLHDQVTSDLACCGVPGWRSMFPGGVANWLSGLPGPAPDATVFRASTLLFSELPYCECASKGTGNLCGCR